MSPILRPMLWSTLLTLPAAAQNVKLNGPLARRPMGSFQNAPLVSPDGQRLVYAADRDEDSSFELYSVPVRGKELSVRLSESVAPNAFRLVPAGGDVVLQSLDPALSLAVVPLDGSAAPRSLSGALAPDRAVSWFEPSRDAVHVLYAADQRADEVMELFRVPIAGGPPVPLNASLVLGGDVQTVVLSSDGRFALYSADQDIDETVELYVVPVDGSAPARKLPLPLVPGGDVAFFQFGRDGANVLYTADQDEDERFELFTIPTDGSQPPRRLNGALVAGGDVGASDFGSLYSFFVQSFDGSRVLYVADQETDGRLELYSAPADGSAIAVKLSTATDRDIEFLAASYDSAWVVYASDPSRSGTRELFSVPIDGSAPARRLSGPMPPGGDAWFPEISFDSRHVVYGADQDTNDVSEVYSVLIDGSTPPVKLNAPLISGGDVENNLLLPGFWVMSDGVVYKADQEHEELFELYFVPIAGGAAPRKLATGPVEDFQPIASHLELSPTDFGAVQFVREGRLYSVPVDPGASPRLLDELSAGAVVGDVELFELTPDGERVTYLAREEGDRIAELHSARTGERHERVSISESLGAALIPSQWLTEDGTRVVFESIPSLGLGAGLYSATLDGTNRVELRPPSSFSVFSTRDSVVLAPDGHVAFLVFSPAGSALFGAPADGHSPPVPLSTALPSGWSVEPGMRISTSGGQVAFLASSGGVHRLYTSPLDGGTPARLVSGGESVALGAFDFQIAPTGARVAFRTEGRKSELFLAPVDGSIPPQRLSATLQARGNVVAFTLAPDEQRVVYLADQGIDETFELFSVPADGSAPPVLLHPALAPGRDVLDFQISSDSQRVVYRSDSLVDEQLELLSVPIDASRAPVRLGRILVTGGDVLDYQISPDGKNVVYRADSTTDDLVELFSSPSGGSRGPVKLSRALVPGGDVRSFRISADSRMVAFAAQRDALGARTLLVAPIRGEGKALELAGPFQGGGTVFEYAISADGSRVAYRADQEAPGVIELFASRRSTAPPAVRH